MSRVSAVTNEYGEQATLADTISPVGLHETPRADREPRKKEIKTDEIYDLTRTYAYGILANYLMHTYELAFRKGVRYGRDGDVKWIEVDKRTYWERKGVIHDRFGRKK